VWHLSAAPAPAIPHPSCLPCLALPPDTYNSLNGFAGDCTTCPGSGAGTFTSYAAAQQCDTARVDTVCTSGGWMGGIANIKGSVLLRLTSLLS